MKIGAYPNSMFVDIGYLSFQDFPCKTIFRISGNVLALRSIRDNDAFFVIFSVVMYEQ